MKNIKLSDNFFNELDQSDFIDLNKVEIEIDSVYKKKSDSNQIVEIYPIMFQTILKFIIDNTIKNELFKSLEKISLQIFEKYYGTVFYTEWIDYGKLPTPFRYISQLPSIHAIGKKLIKHKEQIDSLETKIKAKQEKDKLTSNDKVILRNYENKLTDAELNYSNTLTNLVYGIRDTELTLGGMT